MNDPARPRASRTRTRSTRSSSTRPSRCSRRSARTSASTGRTTLKEEQAFKSGDTVIGTTLAGHRQPRRRRDEGAGHGRPAQARARPAGPTPGWSSSKAKHPNCAYKWMDYIVSPVGERAGGASTSARRRPTRKACDRDRRSERSATTFHAADKAYCRQDLVLDDADHGSASTAARTSRAPTTRTGPRPGPRSRADAWRRGDLAAPARPPDATGAAAGLAARLAGAHRCCWLVAWPTSARWRRCSSPRSGRTDSFTGDVVDGLDHWTTSRHLVHDPTSTGRSPCARVRHRRRR